MLTPQKCREILGVEYVGSDAELDALRNDLYALAEIATDHFIQQTKERQEK